MRKSDIVIDKFKIKVEEAAGKKGVKLLREKLDRLTGLQKKIIFNLKDYKEKFKLNERWAHRKKILVSPTMKGKEEQYRKILSSKAEYKRGAYGEIIEPTLTQDFYHVRHEAWQRLYTKEYSAAKKCIRAIETQGFDEHGGWASGADFDKHGRGHSINTDIYGIDYENNLFVVQVRLYQKRCKNGFANVRKNYFLIGYNENGNPFAHSVPSQTVHSAIKKDPSIESPVSAVRAWIWGIDRDKLDSVLRNGDVALIPVNRNFKKDVEEITSPMRIIDSHFIYAKKIYKNGGLYAFNPTIRHMKGQHPTQKGKGWYKIMIGNRAGFHDFASPTKD